MDVASGGGKTYQFNLSHYRTHADFDVQLQTYLIDVQNLSELHVF